MSRSELFLSKLPDDAENCVVVLSGGMDSAVAARLCVEKYGNDNVHSISFFYNQKQSDELRMATRLSVDLKLKSHRIFNIDFLGEIAKPISANVVGGLAMPTIRDILGDPTPPTYVPNRNAILLMSAAAYAESHGLGLIVTGLQSQDQYGYHDTTPSFVRSLNAVLDHARVRRVQICAPFLETNKCEEILLLNELDGNVNMLANTLTCYNPNSVGESCGRCPSCAERIANFKKANIPDPIKYPFHIEWV
jgi:7-cyano-7-deazaguanine synthase